MNITAETSYDILDRIAAIVTQNPHLFYQLVKYLPIGLSLTTLHTVLQSIQSYSKEDIIEYLSQSPNKW